MLNELTCEYEYSQVKLVLKKVYLQSTTARMQIYLLWLQKRGKWFILIQSNFMLRTTVYEYQTTIG